MIRFHLWSTCAAGLLVCCASAGCSGGSDVGQSPEVTDVGAAPPEGFQFATSSDVVLDLVVRLDGIAVQGAIVQVADVAPDSQPHGDDLSVQELFFAGASTADGTIRADISVPLDREHLDVVVDLAGAEGPYTAEEQRTAAGRFAASSRVTYERAAFTGLLFVELSSN